LNVSSGGLNAQGQWVWNVTITPSATGTPLAAELGFRETTAGSQLVGATKNAAVWDTDNPGVQIFNWETLTDVDTSPTVTNNRPVGLQTNVTNDEVFSALGSIDLTSGNAVQYITITTKGPTATNPTSTIAVLGKHGTGGTSGRIAEITGTTATNYAVSGTATRTAFAGDVNLSGAVDFDDVLAFSPNFNKTVTNGWAGGDFTGDGNVNFDDVLALSPNFGKSGGTNTPLTAAGVAGGAAAGLGASAVPEPTSVMLVALGSLLLAAFGLRKGR
jgi:hypothetical protein